VARPVSINVTTFGTGKIPDFEITKLVQKLFDLRPAAIISSFDLRNLPAKHKGKFYEKVAAYGHFGRPDLDLPWEQTNKVKELKQALAESAKIS
jgi:S-adenosylmethionine synthetase